MKSSAATMQARIVIKTKRSYDLKFDKPNLMD